MGYGGRSVGGPWMKAALWLRVSTVDQTTDNQRIALESEASRRGLEIAKVYDVAASAFQGAHEKVLRQVYRDARANRFKVLMVWSLDRLTRKGPAAQFEIFHRLTEEGVQLLSLQQSWIEVEGPARELLIMISGYIGKMESDQRSERTKEGLRRAVAEGKRLGRPPGSTDSKKRKKRGSNA